MMFDRAELETVSKRVDRAAIHLYAEITDDFNPIHIDPEFAAKTPMGGIIAHGMLSLNLVWQAIRKTYGDAGAECATLDIRFVSPVREDDVVTASGLRRVGSASVYDVTVVNQHGKPVISGSVTLSA